MAEYLTRDTVETVALNSAISFIDSIPCNRGYDYHQSGTGIFVLRGKVNNPSCGFARYNIVFTGNIAIPEGGAITPIATAIVVSGEERNGSRSIFTPAAVEQRLMYLVAVVLQFLLNMLMELLMTPQLRQRH